MNKYYPDEPVNIHIQSRIYYLGEKLGNYQQKRVRENYQYFVVMENRLLSYIPPSMRQKPQQDPLLLPFIPTKTRRSH